MLTHSIVKENGKYLDGKEHEAVVNAIMHDKTSCVVDGNTIHILKHTIDPDGSKVTIVAIEDFE